MRVKIRKLKEAENPMHPNNIDVGYEREGKYLEPPKVGFAFWVGEYWRTSPVQEIIDTETFRTLNSIYKYKLIEQ